MKYDELDDAAKVRAREWFASTVFEDSSDWDHVYADVAEVGALMGIVIDDRVVKTVKGTSFTEPDIRFSGFSFQGDGASFSALLYVKDMAGCVARVKEHAPADESLHALAAHAEEIHALITAYHVARRLDGQDVDTDEHPECEPTMTIAIVDTAHGFRTMVVNDLRCPPEISALINQFVEDFARWIYKSLEAEYDHLTDDETVEETIRANEFEFDEDGHVE